MHDEYAWPPELRSAVNALAGDLEWQILAAVVDSPHTADELSIKFDVDHDAVATAVKNLTCGGLVHKRDAATGGEPTTYRVELAEYGARFVDAMFDTLGNLHEDAESSPNP